MPEIVLRFVSEILERSAAPGSTLGVYTGKRNEPAGGKLGPHLLSVDQFSRDSVEDLFRIADAMQAIARRQKVTRVLEGAVLANLFFEASTRTRISFSSAFARLGGSVCDTTGFTFSSMAKGESIHDTSRVISGYADAIVVRHPEEGSVAQFASATNIPVINGGDGAGEHPTQALLDLYTIQREFSRLNRLVDGAHIAFVGDLKYGRTVHSLAKLLTLYHGLKITLISPPALALPDNVLKAIARSDHVVTMSGDLAAGIRGADVIYATRIQKERFTAGEALEGYSPRFRIDRELIETNCGADTLVMHPLPRDSRAGANDLAEDLNRDARLAIFRQTDNGIPVRMAIFATLLGVASQALRSMKDASWRTPAYVGPEDALFHGIDA